MLSLSLENPGTLSVHILVGQIWCVPDDVFMIILIKSWRKNTSQYTPQLVETAVKEIMKVESSKQIHSWACCSMTVDSKSQTQHLVAPAISTNIIRTDQKHFEIRGFDVTLILGTRPGKQECWYAHLSGPGCVGTRAGERNGLVGQESVGRVDALGWLDKNQLADLKFDRATC